MLLSSAIQKANEKSINAGIDKIENHDITLNTNLNIDKFLNLTNKDNSIVGLSRYCNICGFRFGKFYKYGVNPREAFCPVCGSLERHRHLAIHLFSMYPFLNDKRILHFAPENIIKNILTSSEADYYDADIDEKKASWKVDITSIRFDNNYFDYIICFHVLEHIVDDLKAMSELYRVLKPNGIAFLSVPIFAKLFEDYSIVSPEEREKFFGQRDHVRKYDFNTFCARIKNVGFDINVSNFQNFPSVFNDAMLGSNIILAQKPDKYKFLSPVINSVKSFFR